ncbi:CU044_5270 family protein [Nonomuraea sp. NPDC049269]|uniref:CU044_5270 family protein n=1 Tax=Nonomuraea sp. NPDC049269 TaxID=3364349 RepID=UPI0037189446
MKEFQLIDDVMPDVPPADHARVMAVRARMLNDAPRRRLPGWSRVALAAASVALVLIGGFVVVPGLGGGPDTAATQEDPAQALATAADRLAAQPPGEGAWWRREMVRITRKATPHYTVEYRNPEVMWISRDGVQRIKKLDLTAAPVTRADEQAWKDAGSPPLCDSKSGCQVGKTFYGPVELSEFKPVTGLPTDAEALETELLKRYSDPRDNRETWLWTVACQLLEDAETTPGTRAALYRMLTELPGVRVADGVTDLDGRTGLGLLFNSPEVLQQIIIDRESGDLLAIQRTPTRSDGSPVGELVDSNVIKKLGWTDEAPKD